MGLEDVVIRCKIGAGAFAVFDPSVHLDLAAGATVEFQLYDTVEAITPPAGLVGGDAVWILRGTGVDGGQIGSGAPEAPGYPRTLNNTDLDLVGGNALTVDTDPAAPDPPRDGTNALHCDVLGGELASGGYTHRFYFGRRHPTFSVPIPGGTIAARKPSAGEEGGPASAIDASGAGLGWEQSANRWFEALARNATDRQRFAYEASGFLSGQANGPFAFRLERLMRDATRVSVLVGLRRGVVVTAGTVTANIKVDDVTMGTATLTSADNGGQWNRVLDAAQTVAAGGEVTVEISTDGAFTHDGAGQVEIAAVAEFY